MFATDLFITDNVHDSPVHNRPRSQHTIS